MPGPGIFINEVVRRWLVPGASIAVGVLVAGAGALAGAWALPIGGLVALIVVSIGSRHMPRAPEPVTQSSESHSAPPSPTSSGNTGAGLRVARTEGAIAADGGSTWVNIVEEGSALRRESHALYAELLGGSSERS